MVQVTCVKLILYNGLHFCASVTTVRCTVWVITLSSAVNGHLSGCPSKKPRFGIFYPFFALHWVHRQGNHPSTIPDWCTSPCLLDIFQSVCPPNGQWLAPMGSWRVQYCREQQEFYEEFRNILFQSQHPSHLTHWIQSVTHDGQSNIKL